MSWTMQLPGQVSKVGTTSPTPLPDRVGAKQRIYSAPSWRRYALLNRPSTPPSPTIIPAASVLRPPAHAHQPLVSASCPSPPPPYDPTLHRILSVMDLSSPR